MVCERDRKREKKGNCEMSWSLTVSYSWISRVGYSIAIKDYCNKMFLISVGTARGRKRGEGLERRSEETGVRKRLKEKYGG